jgi:hypothetical protein
VHPQSTVWRTTIHLIDPLYLNPGDGHVDGSVMRSRMDNVDFARYPVILILILRKATKHLSSSATGFNYNLALH